MKDEHHEPSAALPLVVVALFMLAVMGGGFFVVKKFHVDTVPTATATPPAPSPTPPPTPTPIPTPTPTPIPIPTGTVSIESPTGSNPPNTMASVARLRPGFRACYNKGLADDPSLSGNMIIEIEIAANGDVMNVTKVGGMGLGPIVESCIIRRARGATFDAPGGAGAKVRVPLTFVKQ